MSAIDYIAQFVNTGLVPRCILGVDQRASSPHEPPDRAKARTGGDMRERGPRMSPSERAFRAIRCLIRATGLQGYRCRTPGFMLRFNRYARTAVSPGNAANPALLA
jgi:hypothetical protein